MTETPAPRRRLLLYGLASAGILFCILGLPLALAMAFIAPMGLSINPTPGAWVIVGLLMAWPVLMIVTTILSWSFLMRGRIAVGLASTIPSAICFVVAMYQVVTDGSLV